MQQWHGYTVVKVVTLAGDNFFFLADCVKDRVIVDVVKNIGGLELIGKSES